MSNISQSPPSAGWTKEWAYDLAARAEKRPRIYIAGPMTSSGDPYENVGHAIRTAMLAWKRGWAPVLPHLDVLWSIAMPGDHPEWLEWDLANIRDVDAILRIPGYSRGAEVECWYADKLGLPQYTEENLPYVGPALFPQRRELPL